MHGFTLQATPCFLFPMQYFVCTHGELVHATRSLSCRFAQWGFNLAPFSVRFRGVVRERREGWEQLLTQKPLPASPALCEHKHLGRAYPTVSLV